MQSVPTTLTARPQWVLWRLERGTKVPYATTGGKASSTNPATWATYAAACAALTKRYSGLGYVFSGEDGLVGVDLDDCRNPDTGEISPAARRILDKLNSYSEVSPSKRGVKVWVRGSLPRAVKVTEPAPGIKRIEVYARGRYFAVTGERLEEYPAEPQEAQAVLDALLAKFAPDSETPRPVDGQGPTPASKAPEWARKKLATVVTMIATAAEGEKHDKLLDASILAGGLLQHISRMEVESAIEATLRSRPTIKDWRGAMRTVADGMKMGEAKPLTPPRDTPPLVWRDGVPYCPACGEHARPSRYETDAFYCPCERPALSWRGKDATPPALAYAPSREIVDSTPEGTEIEPALTPEGFPIPLGVMSLVNNPPPPVVWFVPGFLREGFGLLVGQPNVGKTPLVIQLALAIASGSKWLDVVPCRKSKVLFWGAEYTQQELYPTLMESAGSMGLVWGRDVTDDDFAFFYNDHPTPSDPATGVAMMEFYIRAGFAVTLIDTLTAWLPTEQFKQNIYRGDYNELKPYHKLALRHRAAMLGTWHSNKAQSDPKLMYNGSTGMWGVPSSRLTMYEDGEGRKRLASFPRLGDRTDWALTQGKNLLGRRWIVSDATPEPEMGSQERSIWRWLKANSDRANPKSPATIADMVSLPANTVRTCLGRMHKRNLVAMGKGGSTYYVEEMTDVADVAPVAGDTPAADVAPVAPVADVAGSFPHREISATNVALMLRSDSASESLKTGAQQAQQGFSQHEAQQEIFEGMPDEKVLRTAGYKWNGLGAGWYGYTPGRATVGPLETREAVLEWLWQHYLGEAQ